MRIGAVNVFVVDLAAARRFHADTLERDGFRFVVSRRHTAGSYEKC
jgi:hypothetical protein